MRNDQNLGLFAKLHQIKQFPPIRPNTYLKSQSRQRYRNEVFPFSQRQVLKSRKYRCPEPLFQDIIKQEMGNPFIYGIPAMGGAKSIGFKNSKLSSIILALEIGRKTHQLATAGKRFSNYTHKKNKPSGFLMVFC